MNRLTRTTLAAALLAAPTSLILTGCAKSAPDSLLLPAVVEAPPPTSPAFAQSLREGMPFGLLLQHRAELGLTEAQVAQLEAIRERLRQQNQPLLAQLREAGVMRRAEGMRAHRMAPGQRQEMQRRMQEMTPEQREEMRTRMQRMREMTPEQREEMRRRMQEMTPEQREQMRARLQEQRAQAAPRPRAMPERRLPENLRPVARQVQENHRAAMQEARAVLTAEQQTRLRELMQEHRRSFMERRGATGPRGPQGVR